MQYQFNETDYFTLKNKIMSSFIHSAKHFNSLEFSLIREFKKDKFILNYSFWRNLQDGQVIEKIKEIIGTLREINVLTVSLQYAHHYKENLNNEIAEQLQIVKDQTTCVVLNKVDIFLALRSLNYKIELEHLTDIRNLTDSEVEALEFLNNTINSIAVHIVQNSEACDSSKAWAI